MIYLDYSATTPVDDRVLDSYIKVTKDFPGNANSIHTLGSKSKELLLFITVFINSLSFSEIGYLSTETSPGKCLFSAFILS